MQKPSPAEDVDALLARLSQRQGVQGVLILALDTGAIVRSSGLITDDDETEEERPSTSNGTEEKEAKKGTRRATEVASLVWKFVQNAGALIEGLNGESDENKLLRVRSRKNEIVIVPDQKYLLVVMHETPPAP